MVDPGRFAPSRACVFDSEDLQREETTRTKSTVGGGLFDRRGVL
jgi:hypothetical protein